MLLTMGARPTPSLVAPDGAFRERGMRDALRLFVKSGNVTQHVPGDTLTREGKRRAALYAGTDVIFTVEPSKRLRLDFAKNHIVHWLVDRALVSVAWLSAIDRNTGVTATTLRDRVRSLSRLFKYEFIFRADALYDDIFEDVLKAMHEGGELMIGPSAIDVGVGHDGLDGRAWLEFYAHVLANFIEGYRIAARALVLLVKGPMLRRELVDRALRMGERMFLEGEIELSEAVSQPMVGNALTAFIDQGYLTRNRDELALADSFASEEAARTVESRIAAYLITRPPASSPS
jgi:glycerol-3-phosphate O-acyltransferase